VWADPRVIQVTLGCAGGSSRRSSVGVVDGMDLHSHPSRSRKCALSTTQQATHTSSSNTVPRACQALERESSLQAEERARPAGNVQGRVAQQGAHRVGAGEGAAVNLRLCAQPGCWRGTQAMAETAPPAVPVAPPAAPAAPEAPAATMSLPGAASGVPAPAAAPPVREDQVSNAVGFLSHPSVSSSAQPLNRFRST
jgi:hypothetical protein